MTVIASTHLDIKEVTTIVKEVLKHKLNQRCPVEGIIIRLNASSEITHLHTIAESLFGAISFILVDDGNETGRNTQSKR